MRKKLVSLLLIIALLMSCICPVAYAAGNEVEKLENAMQVVKDSVSELQTVFPDQKTANIVSSMFNEFVSVARTSGTILGVINGSVTFLKLIGLVKDKNAEALANIQTQLKIINEQLETTEKQLNNITAQMSQMQASAEFNTRAEKAIMYHSTWNDFEYRYVETGMESLMTQYNGMLLSGMQSWCLNKTADARTKDGVDHSKIILHYAFADGEYRLTYSAEDEDPRDFAPSDRYLVLSSDFLPSSLSWNVNSYRATITDYIAGKIRKTQNFECLNFPAFEAGSEGLTDALISQVAEDAVNVLTYKVAAAEVNKSASFSLEVERQFQNYCKHLLASEEGMDAIFLVFYLTHAFEYQISDALTQFCNEMAIRTGTYGSFAANVLGMSSFITEGQKSDMLDCYCDALIKIGQAKTNCLNGSGRFCYLTNTELYLGKISFSDQLAVNTSEIGSRRAYESFSSAPMKTDISGSWSGNANASLIGDANALLLTYMLQSNGETADYAYLQNKLDGPADDGGIIVTSINGESALPLNSPVSMDVSNVIGSYFKDGSTVSLRNLPGSADSDYIRYRSMISGSVMDASGTLEVNKVLAAAAVYAEDHWYWEKDEAAVMGGAEYPGRLSKSVSKVETGLEFPGTHYYRTDYAQSVCYNCLVSIPLQVSFTRGQYSPLDSYLQLCKDLGNSGQSSPDHSEVVGFGSSAGAEKNGSGFVDVPEQAYYFDAVKWAAENGITEGTDAAHFGPDAFCTRAQAVTLLWRAAGKPEPKTNDCAYTDVSLNDYYAQALLWAAENKITDGTSETTFSPDAIVSRAQVVTFLYRAGKTDALNKTDNPFTDVPEGTYCYDAILWAVENGITKGTSPTTFSPDADCTRAQIVTFLYRSVHK